MLTIYYYFFFDFFSYDFSSFIFQPDLLRKNKAKLIKEFHLELIRKNKVRFTNENIKYMQSICFLI